MLSFGMDNITDFFDQYFDGYIGVAKGVVV